MNAQVAPGGRTPTMQSNLAILSPPSSDSSRFCNHYHHYYHSYYHCHFVSTLIGLLKVEFWKSWSMATNVCRWTGGRCAARWTSPGWSLVVVSCHWCSLVAILVVIGASYWSSVCGTMDLTRWIFLIINCGLGLSSVVSRCYWLSFGWSLVVIGVHWC